MRTPVSINVNMLNLRGNWKKSGWIFLMRNSSQSHRERNTGGKCNRDVKAGVSKICLKIYGGDAGWLPPKEPSDIA
jgi:hypothetical protein